MSGVKLVQGPDTYNLQSLILANSVHLENGDFVTIDADGFLKRTAATEKIMGYYVGETVDAASDNETVDQVKGNYQPLNLNEVFEMTSDQACTQTDVGAYADISLSTNAFLVNLAAGSTGQLIVIGFDPNDDGSTTTVRVMVAEPQQFAFAQA